MIYVNIHDAKTNLSKYLEQVTGLHQTVIICRSGKPIAQLTEYKAPRRRKLGLLKGKIKIKKDFDQMSDDFMEHFIRGNTNTHFG